MLELSHQRLSVTVTAARALGLGLSGPKRRGKLGFGRLRLDKAGGNLVY